MNVNWEEMQPIEGLVIVIEDDPTLRGLMADILAEIAAKVLAFGTADDALTYLLEHRGGCSLAIVDHGLPGQIQGAEFIELAKSRWPAIATILTSGYLIEPATVPSGTIYLHKPWSIDDFVKSVTTLLQFGQGSTSTTAKL